MGCARRQRVRGLACALLLLVCTAASAHGMRQDVRIDLTPMAIDGLVVELHQDYFSPQLVVANRTGQPLEILDAEGRAFLRIGPKQAEADLAAKAFHLSRVAGGGDAHANTLGPEPRWRAVATEPAYGWFDPRLATATLDVPYAVRQLGAEMPFAQWRIPARLGGRPIEFKGVFSYLPTPAGAAVAVLRSSALAAPGVTVQVLPGTVPAFFLSNAGSLPVAVLGADGKPFLRIGRDGVWADTGHPDWRAASPTAAAGTKGWQQISRGRSTSWLEPRAAWRGTLPKPLPASGELNRWTVPLRIGERQTTLEGINRWVASKPAPRPAEPRSRSP